MTDEGATRDGGGGDDDAGGPPGGSVGGRRVDSFLDDGERLLGSLRGTMLDLVREDGERRRKMSADPGDAVALASNRRLQFLVGRSDGVDATERPLSALRETTLETLGDSVRVTFAFDTGPSYTVYPEEDDEGTVRALLSHVDEEAGNAPADGGGDGAAEDDPLDRLERLAALHERGALSDEEFQRKKSALLDRI